jgi:acyl-CoA synthetase (AMP-forming)/AMP-acid ligase II
MGSAVRLPVLGDIGEATFIEGYGMVETGGGAMTKLSPPYLPVGLGTSLGFAMPGYRFRVVDEDGAEVGFGEEGELQLQGPGVLSGYWGDKEATDVVLTADGWLRTGDQVIQRGPLGLAFQGRSKNVLKVGGYSVYPPEIEEVIEGHPSVVAAAVVGAPDERLGEVPWAAVVLRPGSTTRPDTIRSWAERRLAEYKAPRRIVAVEALPQTGTGKVQRAQVRRMLGIE